jgi:hypothetical protein
VTDDAQTRILAGLPPVEAGEAAAGRPVLVWLSEVTPEPVRWLWPGRIPRDMITVLDGDPDLGKSTVTLDLAARVTTATPFPDGAPVNNRGPVILLSAEDVIHRVIHPRLEEAGADMTKVACLDAITYTEENGSTEERPPVLPGDLATLEGVIRDTGAVLVVIDPLSAYLSERVDAYKDQHVRRALMPMVRLAERTGVAIVIVRHLSKTGGAKAIYRGGGSIGIIGASRAGLLVAADPDDESRRILAPTKANLGPKPPALAYRLIPSSMRDCARVVWEGPTAHQADDLLAVRADMAPEDRSAQDEAVEFLHDWLALGSEKAADVKKAARQAGISESTLDRARRKAGVQFRREGFGPGSVVWWSLATFTRQTTRIGTIQVT